MLLMFSCSTCMLLRLSFCGNAMWNVVTRVKRGHLCSKKACTNEKNTTRNKPSASNHPYHKKANQQLICYARIILCFLVKRNCTQAFMTSTVVVYMYSLVFHQRTNVQCKKKLFFVVNFQIEHFLKKAFCPWAEMTFNAWKVDKSVVVQPGHLSEV